MKKTQKFLTTGLTAMLCLSMASTAFASSYTVSKGDSLWKIAKVNLGNGSRWMEIYDANKGTIKNPNLIYVGQNLIIPDGKNTAKTDNTSSQDAVKTTVTTKTLSAGSVTIYNFGKVKLHAYTTGDALGDVAYIIEGADALVGVELPSFTANLDAWNAYAKEIGKPMNDIFLCDHATGASYVEGMNIYGTSGAQAAVEGGSTYATTKGLNEIFGDDFHGGADMAQINKVVSAGKITVGGIEFNIIDYGDTYDLEIPAINAVYTHMLGKYSHSIMASTAHIDSMLNILKGYQNAGYEMILSSHSAPEGQDAVTEKINYVNKAKEMALSCNTSEEFVAAMQKAFPNYAGENYLTMSAGFIYPTVKEATDEAAIRELLTSYRDALENSSPEEVVANYTVDGVVMGPGSPTIIGDELAATYGAIFKNVGLDIDFIIGKMIIGEKYAIVQSTSDGTALINATGEKAPEENCELFVLEKVDGDWKIARYMYNKTDVLVPANSTEVVENTITGSTAEDEEAVRQLITATYRDALAASDEIAVTDAFTADGVVLPPSSPTATGADAVKANYEAVFEAVELDLQFAIDEVVIDGDYGFVRSTSLGTVKVLATGESGPELNRELFVVNKKDGKWKIAFYMYNKTN